jgi:hypothetical protein
MVHASERRDSIRYPAIENRAFLAWEDGAGHCRVEARLVNVSQSGVLLVSEGMVPPDSQPVWVRIERPCATDWADAVVVRTSRSLKARLTGRGTSCVRLRFLPTCPYDFFTIATQATQLDEACRKSETSEHEAGIWR